MYQLQEHTHFCARQLQPGAVGSSVSHSAAANGRCSKGGGSEQRRDGEDASSFQAHLVQLHTMGCLLAPWGQNQGAELSKAESSLPDVSSVCCEGDPLNPLSRAWMSQLHESVFQTPPVSSEGQTNISYAKP